VTTGAIALPVFDTADAKIRSGRFVAMSHDFGVRSTSPALSRHLSHIFRDLRAAGDPKSWYTVKHGWLEGEWWYELRHEDELLMRTPRVDAAIAFLLWHVNRSVALGSPDHVVLHAAAASRAGTVIAFPAVMEAGKSTLVTALVKDGWEYLSDEALLIERRTLLAVPYPKPITLDPGSWAVHADVRPADIPGLPELNTEQWHVPASLLGVSPSAGGPLRAIIFPAYRPGRATELLPVSRATTVRDLAVQTFDFKGTDVPTLVALARHASCHRLYVSDLEDACRLVRDVALTLR
jgi:hypothetical protein